MNTWTAVLLAAGLAYLTKLAGYLVPRHWLERPVVARMNAVLPVALLAALAGTSAFTGAGGAFVLDARAVAVAVALLMLWRGASFLLVVVAAAVVAAAARALGMA
ncbi:MAG: AzlD domain-containing protein [Dermatophilus congolensis]|nr:AzlD domain-containing protein [Dermatophilus congolensis]